MKIFFSFFKHSFAAELLVGLLFCQSLPAAVSFTVTPAMVSNTYSGNITLQVTGLTNGETVVIHKYLDANTNGVIDAGDPLVQGFQLTDGQASVIGGVTNSNVPGDTDTTAAQITAQLLFQPAFQGPDVALNLIGPYAFRLSSPSGNFGPLTNIFTITNAAYAQSFTGSVRNNGTNVPNAIALLFTPGGDGLNPQGGTLADNSGNYSIKAPPGSYLLLAFKPGFIADTATAPMLTLGSGATIVTNLSLISATQNISGKIVDAANPNVGLPGFLLPLESSDGLLAVTFTDTNGNFNGRVNANQWKISGNDRSLVSYGYVGLQGNTRVNTTTGSVAGITIALPKVTALFYGSVRDEANLPLPGIQLFGNDNNDLYETEARTDQNGDYVAGVNAGMWQMGLDNNNPALTNYVFTQGPGPTSISAGQAVLRNFLAKLATHRITGLVKDNNNNPIASISVFANANINGTNYQTINVQTDTGGNYSLNVANGNWSVGVDCNSNEGLVSRGYCCVNNQNVNISNGDGVANFIAVQSGQILITTASPLPNGSVGNFYQIHFDASSCQSPFNWSATNPPSGLTLFSDGTFSGVPNIAGSNYFFVQVNDGGGHSTNKAFSLVINPATTDVMLYYVNKLIAYRQTNATDVVLDSGAGPYNAYLSIVQSVVGSVSIANVTLPTSVVKGFPPGNSAIELQVHDGFATQPALDAAYPAGNYSFAISTVNNGNQFPVLNMPVPAYPNSPRVGNYAAAQSINPAGAFLLQWDAFAGGTTNDSIWLTITETNGTPVFSTPYPGTDFDNSLKGNATSTIIPGGTLQPGRAYVGIIIFFRVTGLNDTSYPGAFGLTLASAQTSFALATASVAPTLGQPSKPSATQFRFLLTGIAGQNYTIQRSTNLSTTNWSVLFVTNAPATSFMVVDPTATNARAFYRALFGP